MLQSRTRFIDCAAVSLLAIAGLAVIGPQIARGVGTTLSMSNCLGNSQADCSNCIQTSNGVSTTSYKCTSTTGVQACVDTDGSGNCITAGNSGVICTGCSSWTCVGVATCQCGPGPGGFVGNWNAKSCN